MSADRHAPISTLAYKHTLRTPTTTHMDMHACRQRNNETSAHLLRRLQYGVASCMQITAQQHHFAMGPSRAPAEQQVEQRALLFRTFGEVAPAIVLEVREPSVPVRFHAEGGAASAREQSRENGFSHRETRRGFWEDKRYEHLDASAACGRGKACQLTYVRNASNRQQHKAADSDKGQRRQPLKQTSAPSRHDGQGHKDQQRGHVRHGDRGGLRFRGPGRP